MSNITWKAYFEEDDAAVVAYRAIAEEQWPGYPPPPVDPKWWRTPFAAIVGTDADGEVIGGCAWIRREIVVDGEKHVIAALAGVVMSPKVRGQGLGSELIPFANDFAKEQGYDWAVLFTGEERIRFYGAAGYSKLEGDLYVTIFDERQRIDPGAIVMAKPLTEKARLDLEKWERATVDVGHGQW